MILADKVKIWEAINRYVETCGGDTSRGVYGSISRQEAVVAVECAIASIERNVTEIDNITLSRCSNCGCPLLSHVAGRCEDCECMQYESPHS